MDAIRDLAAEADLPLVDHTEYWRQHADRHDYWMSDSFHPNHHGHCAFARLLYESLGIYDPESQCCRLFYP
jgi:lysophospholipase L1-like esterase